MPVHDVSRSDTIETAAISDRKTVTTASMRECRQEGGWDAGRIEERRAIRHMHL